MNAYLNQLFTTYPVKTQRALEILPPIVSMTLITMPLWGAVFFPIQLAYFIIFFDVYFFWKSFYLMITSYLSSRKIQATEKVNWLEKCEDLPHFNEMNHLIIIPSYTESEAKLAKTIERFKAQTFPSKRIHIYLALEKREVNVAEKAERLKERFKHDFGTFSFTLHPDLPNEVKGKSSNQAFAVKQATDDLIEKKRLDINYMTVTSVDADALYDPQFCAFVTNSFLTVDDPYHKFWQSATVYYNNFWEIPTFTRIMSFFGSLWATSTMIQEYRLLPHSTYTLSLKLLKSVGFWDVDVIPEDYRIFFKCFFMTHGKVSVIPVFLKTSMDSAQSQSYRSSLMNKYNQERRWAWGVSDDAMYLKWWLLVPNVPFLKKTVLVYYVLLDHILWPVSWFLVTIAANVVALINPVFSRTNLGYFLPHVSGFILTLSLVSLLVMIYVDYTIHRHKHYQKPSLWRMILFPFEFVFMPVAGFFLSALPALISHVQLFIGKRLEYKVTEKV
jgi:cellulose synthase/poly-beta-1,6-N-acetylglucosamine synthase-like glycosyltransferase